MTEGQPDVPPESNRDSDRPPISGPGSEAQRRRWQTSTATLDVTFEESEDGDSWTGEPASRRRIV